MNSLKKIMGIVWMLLGPAVIIFLVMGAVQHIDSNGTKDINKPIPWAIIIGIFTPISIGLMIFGYYSIRGEYSHLPENSDEV